MPIKYPSLDTPLGRIYTITGCQTQGQLAQFLGITQASVSEAKKRGTIPESWLITLLNEYGVLPKWIMTGTGAQFMGNAEKPHMEKALRSREANIISNMLRAVPTSFLHQELYRREDTER